MSFPSELYPPAPPARDDTDTPDDYLEACPDCGRLVADHELIHTVYGSVRVSPRTQEPCETT